MMFLSLSLPNSPLLINITNPCRPSVFNSGLVDFFVLSFHVFHATFLNSFTIANDRKLFTLFLLLLVLHVEFKCSKSHPHLTNHPCFLEYSILNSSPTYQLPSNNVEDSNEQIDGGFVYMSQLLHNTS